MLCVVKGAVEFSVEICLELWLPVLGENPPGAGTDVWKGSWRVGELVPWEAGAALLVKLSKMKTQRGCGYSV